MSATETITDLSFSSRVDRAEVQRAYDLLHRYLSGEGEELDVQRAEHVLSAAVTYPDADPEDFRPLFEGRSDVEEFRFHIEVYDGDSRRILFPQVVVRGEVLDEAEFDADLEQAVADLEDVLLNDGTLYELFDQFGRWTTLRVRRDQVLSS